MYRSITLSFALVLAQVAFADSDKAKEPEFKLIKVDDLVAMQAGARPPSIYDANSDETRGKQGIIPGAELLDSYREYDTHKYLPADKSAPLVFYCHDTK